MAISLYDATVPAWRQILGGAAGFLEKSETHFRDAGVDLDDIVASRLFPDMAPLPFQVMMLDVQSMGGVEGVKAGAFKPPRERHPPADYAACRKLVDDTIAKVDALSRSEVDALADMELFLILGERRIPFTGQGFLLSFSLPNFHFHATTAYDILRMKGAPLGKRDYIGQLQIKT